MCIKFLPWLRLQVDAVHKACKYLLFINVAQH